MLEIAAVSKSATPETDEASAPENGFDSAKELNGSDIGARRIGPLRINQVVVRCPFRILPEQFECGPGFGVGNDMWRRQSLVYSRVVNALSDNQLNVYKSSK